MTDYAITPKGVEFAVGVLERDGFLQEDMAITTSLLEAACNSWLEICRAKNLSRTEAEQMADEQGCKEAILVAMFARYLYRINRNIN